MSQQQKRSEEYDDSERFPILTANQDSLDAIFYKARCEHGFTNEDVPQALIEQAMEMTYLCPTAFNNQPLRIVFVKSTEAKAKLQDCLMPGNKQQTSEASWVAIMCYDTEFYKHVERMCPEIPNIGTFFLPRHQLTEESMVRNANLQCGYFILALRALGLGVLPMSGILEEKMVETFLKDEPHLRLNFIIAIGYPDASKRFPRVKRFEFDEVTKIL